MHIEEVQALLWGRPDLPEGPDVHQERPVPILAIAPHLSEWSLLRSRPPVHQREPVLVHVLASVLRGTKLLFAGQRMYQRWKVPRCFCGRFAIHGRPQ